MVLQMPSSSLHHRRHHHHHHHQQIEDQEAEIEDLGRNSSAVVFCCNLLVAMVYASVA